MTQYSYHAAGWKTNEMQVGMSTNRFTHNPAGDLRTLSDGKSQLTSWGYDAYGRVTGKTNHNNLEILRYKYDPNSRLTNRWSSTKLNTYYDYDAVGNLTNVNYNASTDLRYKYDALGRMTNMVDAAGTTSWYYDPANRRVVEDGPWADDNVTNILNTAGLLATVGVQQPSGSFNAAYAYDSARRLSTVTATSGTFNYHYVPSLNSVTAPTRLVHRITLPNTSFVTNYYDSLARLTDTYLRKNDGASSNRHSYVYNNGHQRTRQTYFNGDYVDYLYDDAGQVYSAKTYNSGGTAIAALNYGFAYDPAANLSRKTNNVTVTAPVLNSLNQVMTNGGAIYTYDNNGNRSTRHDNGMSRYTYDDENQLVVADKDPATYSGAPKTELVYDGKMRLRKRLEYQWNGSLWNLQSETRYLYSGMLAVQERNSSNVPVTTYTRGTDLSGTFDGAGGIGGLLARSHGYSSGSWFDHNFYHADGNGNVTYLVNSSQAMAASYRYEPFGHTITSSGPLAAANLYRFSSKEFLTNSVLYYYGYRFYDPTLQRWLNRDPIEEGGGLNLYGFVDNDPQNFVDDLGLQKGPPFRRGSSPRRPTSTTPTSPTIGRPGVPPGTPPTITNPRPTGPQNPKSSPAPTQYFITPTNPPQPPPLPPNCSYTRNRTGNGWIYTLPDGSTVRVMPPTQQYKDGYWVRVTPPGSPGGAQPMNPRTGKAGNNPADTHVDLPPGFVPPQGW